MQIPLLTLFVSLLAIAGRVAANDEITPVMSDERVVFQTEYGDITFGFWPEVAPVTCAHIFKLIRMGCFISNHFFRVDKGFVAQISDVVGGRTVPMNDEQQREASKTVPLEVMQGVKHHAGVLSMGRYDDPNSGASSFSILLGDAPHLDMQYTAFAKVTEGMESLRRMEELPTRREGIFVMPVKRVTILATYWYRHCEDELAELTMRFESQADELQRVRKKCLPV
ncbi:hypothetical protein VOLCADRAFT_64009 [Volvox carteri f. nagariensis]|uniref:PPIase cyclophilin-type domain-containing protein n=1 Tax=Volvox carteri f. nagariensis TaxID=3068 RepID=D8U5C9_VOLCA|nr:uncharacterized protein VOLCADRAFT_64009 [Volvox carteri f. nagariensis]EFJ45128.1 hypothetical protein VOLCADRAFT_64009 [Volvox carteri f. nagariensis]|eukprot:XP_002953804.1 hypothetical protein VOLCADRAFT_64009 [Volvox carteri f. nagariensis]